MCFGLGCSLDAGPTEPESAPALRLDVIDTGIGIAPEHRHVIWEEFRQIHPDPDDNNAGTGLGLPLTKRLVGLLGGRIGVQSEPGRGSTFSVVLPRTPPGLTRPPSSGSIGAIGMVSCATCTRRRRRPAACAASTPYRRARTPSTVPPGP